MQPQEVSKIASNLRTETPTGPIAEQLTVELVKVCKESIQLKKKGLKRVKNLEERARQQAELDDDVTVIALDLS